MPWNSRRYYVDEDIVRKDQRILAYMTPEGKIAYVVTNRSEKDFTFNIKTSDNMSKSFKGYRYTPENAGKDFMGEEIGLYEGNEINLPSMSWDFWVEQ